MMKKREYGLDLLKALACLGVVSLHTLHPGKGPVNLLIAMLSTLCIPLFFTASGYLMLKRPALTWRYAAKKIVTILLVCLCWEALHAAAHFAVYREVRAFVKSWLMDFFQQGLFYHFWYMGGLILVYLVMPLLDRLMKRSPGVYRAILVGLGILNAVLDILAVVLKSQTVLAIPQSLRFHFWLFYAMLGGYMARNPAQVAKIGSRLKVWHLAGILAIMVLYVRSVSILVFGGIPCEAFYGSLPVQTAAFAVMVPVLRLEVREPAGRKLTFLSSLTMGIYIMHPFVLAVLNKFVPAFTEGGAVMNLLFWIVTTIICAVGTMVVQKLPVLNRLLKL